jgi:hypothetical protein
MSSLKRNPGAGGAGARKCDLFGSRVSSENIPPHRLLQVRHLVGRAALVVSLAWEARP